MLGTARPGDPEQFGEVITNDVRVAKLARELEANPPAKKRRGLRRVAARLTKSTDDTTPSD